ncbi:MAG: glucosaminidase domain-containing protein [Saprospiraceae bacterium]|nr:glucosaminidase domain-containing protein [Saprospiraceae bacterium]
MNKRFFFLVIVLLFNFQMTSLANRRLVDQYIQSYKEIAIAEMYRTKIPASIKLAQGLLESNWGQSDLAITANNHFGIKCGGNWQGRMFFKVDDDTDENGNPVESCFRQFETAQESYIAHSEFLTNPAKQGRYGFLFDYPTTDYVSWSKGLQFSGYATDKKYADKLINVIESYKLHQYDILFPAEGTPSEIYVQQESKIISKVEDEKPVLKNSNITHAVGKENTSSVKKLKKYINGLICVVVSEGETIESISKSCRVNKHDIVIFNESRFYLDTPLKDGQIIFLESKKRFNEDFSSHVVKESESLFDISQKYGIKMSSLASRNKIPEHARLTKGLTLFINSPGMDYSYLREVNVTEEFIDFGKVK